MNKITLSNIEVHAVIGVYPHEHLAPQKLSIHLSFSVDIAHAAINDALSDTQDYSAIYETIMRFVQQSQYRLVETLAYHLRENLIQQFGLINLELHITKQPANLGGASVTVSSCALPE